MRASLTACLHTVPQEDVPELQGQDDRHESQNQIHPSY